MHCIALNAGLSITVRGRNEERKPGTRREEEAQEARSLVLRVISVEGDSRLELHMVMAHKITLPPFCHV